MNKPYKRKLKPEDRMCGEIMTFVRLNEKRWPCLEWFYHCFNEGKRDPYLAVVKGIKAGVSDYHLPVPNGRFVGLWLEIKDFGKEPTPDQARWLDDMRALGHSAHWCDTLQAAFSIIGTYAREATEWIDQ